MLAFTSNRNHVPKMRLKCETTLHASLSPTPFHNVEPNTNSYTTNVEHCVDTVKFDFFSDKLSGSNTNIGMLVSANPSGIEEIKSFDPIINVPALSSFLLIFVVFSFLQLRINDIGKAVERRNLALQQLRDEKSNQLAGVSMFIDDGVKTAKDEYANSLQMEEDLRTILPGIRIAAPNRPDFDDENVAAASLFLGLDLRSKYGDDDENDKDDNKKINNSNDIKNANNNDSEESNMLKGFSGGAIAVMLLVATSQIALLCLLSFDPMKASDVFTFIAGPPPCNLPPSSW